MGVDAGERLQYRDLGALVVERGGVPLPLSGRRLTAMLSLLLVNVNRRVSVDALVDALWGDSPPNSAEATLQSHLVRLRRLLEIGRARGAPFTTVVHEAGGFRLVALPGQIDSLVFAEAAGATRDLLLADQADRALLRSTEALQLWRGRPWTPHSDESWAAAAAAQMEELRAQLRERRTDCLLAVGDVERAMVDLDVLVADHPLRERFWAQRMLASYRLGRTDEALATFQRARSTLADELGVDPGPELRELQTRILAADPSLTSAGPGPVVIRAAVPATVHLPRRRAALVGRVRELAELESLLAAEQLVTVIGPAGCGKTRLIIEAARAAANRFPDGVWFVDVTAADDQRGLVNISASTLGLEIPEAGTAEQALSAFVRNRRMLLVLDHCRHLHVVADLVDRLIDDAELTVAVTGREPLGIDGERVWTLGPLPVPVMEAAVLRSDLPGGQPRPRPDGAVTSGLDALAAEPAVELFVEHAAASGITVAPTDLPTVAGICGAVDGLPLAIELAAALTGSFTLTEILQRVRSDAASLARVDHRGNPELTLSDLIEQSVATLSDTQRKVHQSVSVIPGAFTADAAAVVADLPPNTARDAISGLVRRSLLMPLGARVSGGASRFQQLAPIRSHGRAAAAADVVAERARRRDAWVVDLVGEFTRAGRPQEPAWCRRLDNDWAAVRATLQQRLVDEPGPAGAFVAARLGLYWYYRGMVVEWESWTRLAVASAAADPFDRLLAGMSLACSMGLAGRSDLSAPYVAAADAFRTDGLSRGQAIMLGEFFFHVASSFRVARDVEVGRLAAAAVRRLADQTADEVLDLLAEIAALLADVFDGEPGRLLVGADKAYARAMAYENHYAAWTAATIGTVVSLRIRDPGTGLRWSDRIIANHLRIGVGLAAGPLTQRGCLLAIAGRFYEAATSLAAAQAQSRRCGQRWPISIETWSYVAFAEQPLTGAERDQAHRDGQSLDLADIELDPDALLVDGPERTPIAPGPAH